MSNQEPTIGSRVKALTTTTREINVVIEVTAIDETVELGWYVYGYRAMRRNHARQTAFPRLYFVPRNAS